MENGLRWVGSGELIGPVLTEWMVGLGAPGIDFIKNENPSTGLKFENSLGENGHLSYFASLLNINCVALG